MGGKFTKEEQELLEPSRGSRVSQDKVELGKVQGDLFQNGRGVLNPFDPRFDRLVIHPEKPITDQTGAVRDKLSSAISPDLWKLPEEPKLQKYMKQFDELAKKDLLDLDVFLNNVGKGDHQNDNLEGQTVDTIRAYNKEDKLRAVKAIAFNRLNTKKNPLFEKQENGSWKEKERKSCLELLLDDLEKEDGADLTRVDENGNLVFFGQKINKKTCNLTYKQDCDLMKTTGFEMPPHNEEDKCGIIDLRKDLNDNSENPELVSDKEKLKRLLESGLFSEEVLKAMQATGKPIVECLTQWNATWLANMSSLPRYVDFGPGGGYVGVIKAGSDGRSPGRGVRRLLRV